MNYTIELYTHVYGVVSHCLDGLKMNHDEDALSSSCNEEARPKEAIILVCEKLSANIVIIVIIFRINQIFYFYKKNKRTSKS